MAKEEIERVTMAYIFLGVVTQAVAVVLACVILLISSKMQRLLVTLKKITQTNAIYMRMEIDGHDEFVQIGSNFNDLLEKIVALVQSSQEKSLKLKTSSDTMNQQLSEVIETISCAI